MVNWRGRGDEKDTKRHSWKRAVVGGRRLEAGGQGDTSPPPGKAWRVWDRGATAVPHCLLGVSILVKWATASTSWEAPGIALTAERPSAVSANPCQAQSPGQWGGDKGAAGMPVRLGPVDRIPGLGGALVLPCSASSGQQLCVLGVGKGCGPWWG